MTEKKNDKNQYFKNAAILKNIRRNVDARYPDADYKRRYAIAGYAYRKTKH